MSTLVPSSSNNYSDGENVNPQDSRSMVYYPNPMLIKLGKSTNDKFEEVKMRIQEMHRIKKTPADYQAVDTVVKGLISQLNNYSLLVTRGGKRRHKKTVRKIHK